MYYVVTTERLTEVARSAMPEFVRFQQEYDQYLRGRGWRARSIRHYLTAVGAPQMETWEEYANLGELQQDLELLKRLGREPAWADLARRYTGYLERVETRVLEPIAE
ncbi:MAG: hypothetical protein HY331_09340 [Chloroflexi bacterium]|nr:hypothetical protein [Chloroflexota bacterium]